MTGTLQPAAAGHRGRFDAVAGQDKLQLLLEFSEELPPLPARYAEHRELLEPVPECQSPLFLAVEVADDGIVHLFFDAPPEAPTTRGFAEHPAHRAGRADRAGGPGHAGRVHHPARPQDLVSPLRLRGMAAMLARIKRQVQAQQDEQAARRRAAGGAE